MGPVWQRDQSQGLGSSEQGLPKTLKLPPRQQKRTRWGVGDTHIGELSSGVDKRGRGEQIRGRTLKLGRVCGLEWSREQCPA